MKLGSVHSTSSFFFKIVWTILGHLNFSMNFKTLLPISTRKPAGILVRIVLHLQISLGSTAVLMILSSSPWRWDAFYLDIFFQWFFFVVFRVYFILLKYIPVFFFLCCSKMHIKFIILSVQISVVLSTFTCVLFFDVMFS